MYVFYLMVFGMPLLDQSFYGFSIGGITVTKYLGVICAVYAVAYLFYRKDPPQMAWKALALLFTGFFLAALASYATIGSHMLAWYQSMVFVDFSMFMLYFNVIIVVDTARKLKYSLMAALGGVSFGGLYLLREYQKLSSVYGADYRPGYVTGDPNYYSLSVVIVLPACLLMLIHEKLALWERIYLTGGIAVTTMAIMLASSRGGFLGLIVSFAILVLRSRRRLRNSLVIGGVLVPLLLLSPRSPVQRMMHPNRDDDVAKQQRLVTWNAGLRMIEAHPWFGVGLESFKTVVTRYELPTDEKVIEIAHNTYIEIGAEMGIPTLLIYMGLYITAIFVAESAMRRTRGTRGFIFDTALGIQAGIAGAMVALIFISAEFLKLPWMFIGLSACLTHLARVEVAAAEPIDAPQEVPVEPALWTNL